MFGFGKKDDSPFKPVPKQVVPEDQDYTELNTVTLVDSTVLTVKCVESFVNDNDHWYFDKAVVDGVESDQLFIPVAQVRKITCKYLNK